jgi:hypothetical protein
MGKPQKKQNIKRLSCTNTSNPVIIMVVFSPERGVTSLIIPCSEPPASIEMGG